MTMEKPGWLIQKLDRSHIAETFDCGYEDLNRYIARFALNNQAAGSTQTYVATADKKVVGYYSLAVGAVAHSQAPVRMAKGLARHPVPVMLLARLAVDITVKGNGLGATLLHDALAYAACTRHGYFGTTGRGCFPSGNS